MKEYYTHYPRTILWLVRGGECIIGGGEADAQPRFQVAIEPFYISKLPITNQQYEAFDPTYLRSPRSSGDRDPAVGVSLVDAMAYCRWYSRVSRKVFRLPTEFEWEYACRAGNEGATYFEENVDVDAYVWDRENSGGRARDAEEKKPNRWGLHGLLGGVWEWTCSLYAPYPGELRVPGDEEPGPRVLRGGSYRLHRDELSCSLRKAAEPGRRFDDAGFRILRLLR